MTAEPRYTQATLIVVKVGSSTLTAADGGLDAQIVHSLVDQIAALHREGVRVVLVSSGAVAAGLRPLGMTARPVDLGMLQAAASVGQGALVHAYATALKPHGLACGQVLLTPSDLVDRERYLNTRSTFTELLKMPAIPVVNENDTVATEELRFGDNDRLAALVASMLHADALMLLTDVEGLHDGDPTDGAALIDRVDDLSTLDGRHRGATTSAVGTGGMGSKLDAARIATFSAAHCVIARGRRPDVILDVARGKHVGTWFPPARKRPESRRLWRAFAHQPAGAIHVDGGAVRALAEHGSSLLAIGVTKVEGDFAAGATVDLLGPDGHAVARGIARFDAAQVQQMQGRPTADATVNGDGPVVHRDDMVVTV